MAEAKKTASKAPAKAAVKTKTPEKSTSSKVVSKVAKAFRDVVSKVGGKKKAVEEKPVKAIVKAATTKVATTIAPKPAAKVATKPVAKPVVEAKPVKAPAKVVAKPATKPSAPAPKASAKKADTHSFNPEYLVLMQKDPNWMQAFWEVNDERVKSVTKGGKKLVLRLYDVSRDLTVRAHRSRTFRDFHVPADARSWYIENGSKSGQFAVSLGSISEGGNFEAIVDGSKVMSFGSEGQFLGTGDDLFLRASLGGNLPGGFGSSQFGLSSQQSLPWTSSLAGSSESGSSWGFGSSGAWNQASAWQGLGKDFFLWVKTRLIVYGGTRPDAHLQVRGEPFPLNPDGTFSFEQDLPDSTQIIPVFATDKDGDFPTTIVPIVVKRTE